MELRQFARHGDAAAGKRCADIMQCFDDAVRAFEEDERRLELRELLEEPLPLALLLRHEAGEEEAVGGKPRKANPVSTAEGPGRR